MWWNNKRIKKLESQVESLRGVVHQLRIDLDSRTEVYDSYGEPAPVKRIVVALVDYLGLEAKSQQCIPAKVVLIKPTAPP